MLNCFKCKLIPPTNFIAFNNQNNQFKEEIWVDACVAEEISFLWNNGIRTTGCCCGHGIEEGTICVVKEDRWRMIEELGYKEKEQGIFYAKSKSHFYFGECEYYNG